MDKHFMEKAYQYALIAKEEDEIPVGAIIVKNNEIISYGYNQRQNNKKISAHAEIIAIENASKKLNSWKLNDCTLYVTLEPCMMCTGAIIQSHINRVVFGAYEEKEIAFSKLLFLINNKELSYHPVFTGGVLEKECSNVISEYFIEKRTKKH